MIATHLTVTEPYNRFNRQTPEGVLLFRDQIYTHPTPEVLQLYFCDILMGGHPGGHFFLYIFLIFEHRDIFFVAGRKGQIGFRPENER